MQKSLEFLQKIGEQMKNDCFNPSTLAEELASLGFSLQENLSPEDIEERYFKGRSDGYHAYEHGHFVCAVTE
jgi:O-methyltransferase involved in polyketide biosynthesis